MNSLIQTGDIVKLDIKNSELNDITNKLQLIASSKNVVTGLYASPKKIAKKISDVKDCEVDTVIDDSVYVKYKDSTEIEVRPGEDSVNVTNDCVSCVYGIVVDCSGNPFVSYYVDDTVLFVPYQKVEGNITNTYRHLIASDEGFRLQLTHMFLMPDIVKGMCGETSNYTAAMSFYGNICLNYIYFLFGIMGVPFPQEWAKDGAPEEMLTDYSYGFIEV